MKQNIYLLRSGLGFMAALLFTTIPAETQILDEGDTAPADIGSRLELFVDNFLIEELNNVQLMLHKPKDEGPVLFYDKPWEGPFSGNTTVIKDGDLFRLYYKGWPQEIRNANLETTCYAESRDGIHWTKPDLGLYTVQGTDQNNVVLADMYWVSFNISPFLDTREGVDPSERYKALGGDFLGLYAFTSPDGIHWNLVSQDPVYIKGRHLDAQVSPFWSEEEQQYICYYRKWIRVDGKRYRTIGRTTSKDFIHWTHPVEMEYGDTPREQIATTQTHPYFRAPHIYIALAARLRPEKQEKSLEEALRQNTDLTYSKEYSDGVLMSSRGGNRFDRTFMEPFIQSSPSNYPALNVVQTAREEMSLYVNQHYGEPNSRLQRYTLRLDGFASVHASGRGGEMITKPFRFTGKTLYLNYTTSRSGFIKVEILNPEGKIMKGFELEKTKELTGDNIRKAVSWEESPYLAKLSGQAIRLRFVMKDADLYSLKFE